MFTLQFEVLFLPSLVSFNSRDRSSTAGFDAGPHNLGSVKVSNEGIVIANPERHGHVFRVDGVVLTTASATASETADTVGIQIGMPLGGDFRGSIGV